jgi:hypothetical protein
LYTEGYREADNNGFNETGRNADLILTAFVSNHGWDEECYDVDSEFEKEAWAVLQAA